MIRGHSALMRSFGLLALGMALAAVSAGCSGSSAPRAAKVDSAAPKGNVADQPAAKAEAVRAGAEAQGNGAHGGAPTTPLPRKIIYNAVIELVAEDLGKAEQELSRLVKEGKAYVARSELRGTTGSPRSGSWTIRVPVQHFDAFREALLKLGEVQKDSIDSQDVTDQFYDLDARIRTNKAEESSLLKLLDQARDHQQMLSLRNELNRLRGELEVQQGQLNRLDKLSTLATYTLTIHERRGYVPPASPEFGTRLGRAFGDSLGALRGFGEGAALVAVALAPWLPVVFLVVAPLWVLRRRSRRAIVERVHDKTLPITAANG
jgi:hypothetical protein